MIVKNSLERDTQAEQRKRTIGRLHRIQGQLAALERNLQADYNCEDLVTQAMAIEQAVSSLVIHIIEGRLSNQTKSLLEENPEQALKEIKKLFELISRYIGTNPMWQGFNRLERSEYLLMRTLN